MFHWPWAAPKAESRFIVATREESRKARIARVHTELQLSIAVARMTPEERAAAVARASVRASLAEAIEKQRGAA